MGVERLRSGVKQDATLQEVDYLRLRDYTRNILPVYVKIYTASAIVANEHIDTRWAQPVQQEHPA